MRGGRGRSNEETGEKKWEIYGAGSGKPGKQGEGKTAGGAEEERKSGNRATESETKKVTEGKVRREKTEKRPYERKNAVCEK